ncbi:predicted protein [Histoplasma mississippiense (nom. inval.)]|uniref:predicted protein n=1 Tax=Ajellomyces capsulatus (strain NAm1 / WU24) TaxID=2059318 RepID=UPI000157D5DE|nr:predicted protein [Histoplasma mississippiense (nom. inval.)]EDN05350.1 predicted protein [Histoplasma mississippiense (nom. inval.)]
MRDAAVHMQQLEDTEAVSVQGIFDPDSGNDDVWVSQQLREFNVNADDQEAVIEFLRQKVEGQGIEHNQLMEMFCWLRGIYQEAERGKIESEGGGGMDVHSIQGRSGYEIQHIQIKSDNSAGKGLHCGVKVNELRQRSGAKRCKINKVN